MTTNLWPGIVFWAFPGVATALKSPNLHPLNRRTTQIANGRFRVGCTKYSRSGDDDLSSSCNHFLNIVAINSAVDLDPNMQPALINHLAQPPHFVDRLRDEGLPSESRIHRHHQNIVGKLQRFFYVSERRRWV